MSQAVGPLTGTNHMSIYITCLNHDCVCRKPEFEPEFVLPLENGRVTLGYFLATPTPTLQNPLPLGRVRVLRCMGKGIEGYRGYTIPPG